MAAAEYYSGGSLGGGGPPMSHPNPPQYPPQQHNLHPQHAAGLPYPVSDAPPPYSAYAEQRPHSQPPPQHRPTQPGGPSPAPPTPHAQYPPDKNAYPQSPQVHNMFSPQDFNHNYQAQQPPYPPQGYYPPPGQQHAMQQVYGGSNGNAGQRPSSSPGYGRPQGGSGGGNGRYDHSSSRSRSRSRSHSRHRKHRHHNEQKRSAPTRKKSSGVDTFLGAGGGAIIGDAIFPGLGTLGGALLGGIGGHEYGKRRSHSHPHRTRERSYSNDGARYDGDYRRGRKY